jgi:hypothetical protein
MPMSPRSRNRTGSGVMFKEEWRPVPFAPDYEVSSYGNVRRGGRLLSILGGGRYRTVGINGRTHRVHSLIAEAYHGPRPPGFVTRHLDGSSDNNTPGNVVWGTQSENVMDAVRQGTWSSPRGSKHYNSKLSEDDVILIRRMRGRVTCKQLGEFFGVSSKNISSIWCRESWSWL